MRFIPIIVCFVLLTLLGGQFTTGIYGNFIENGLIGQAKRYFASEGYDDVKVEAQHHFIKLDNLPRDSRELARVSSGLDRAVCGVYIPPVKIDTEVEIEFRDENQVVISGQVPKQLDRVRIGQLVMENVDGKLVDNQLDYGSHVIIAPWLSSAKNFLTEFLPHSGFESFVADKNGFTLSGTTETQAEREALSRFADQTIGGFGTIHNQLGSRTLDPAVFAIATLDSNSGLFAVSGLVSSDSVKQQLLTSIGTGLADKTIQSDGLIVRSGVTDPWWIDNVGELIGPFFSATDNSGSFVYSSNTLELNGLVREDDVIDHIASIGLTGKPSNYQVDNKLIVEPHMNPEIAARMLNNGKIVVTGRVNNEHSKSELIANLKDEFPEELFSEEIIVSSGVIESRWTSVEEFLVNSLKTLNMARVHINNDSITINGAAPDLEAKNYIDALAEEAIGGKEHVYSKVTIEAIVSSPVIPDEDVVKSVEALEITELEENPSIKFKSTAVYFAVGSATVSEEDKSDITRLVDLIHELPEDSNLVVGGYADMTGDPIQNKELSLRRARAVKDELVSLGTPTGKLTIQHFGEDTSNISPDEHWRSRRVELSLKE